MDNSVEITVLHNCALIIRSGEDSLMVDALSQGKYPFDGISEKYYKLALEGLAPFNGIKCALYTHVHEDHYDKKMNEIYLNKHDIPMFIPDKYLGLEGKFSIEPFSVSYRSIKHSGREYSDVKHYVFYVNVRGYSIYIAGDADFNSDEHADFLAGTRPDVAFFNPFYLSAQKNTIINIAPKRAYIYHVPEKFDSEGIRKMAIDSLKHHEELRGFCSIICEHPYTIKL